MMFVTSNQSVEYWKKEGEQWLQTANDQIKQLADKYSPEQFGVVTYILCLFAKWCPYDSDEFILDY